MRLHRSPALLISLACGCGGLGTDSTNGGLSEPLKDRPAIAPLAQPRLLSDGQLDLADEENCPSDAPPVGVSHTLNLWPPNHTLHTISAADCVTISDDCDEGLVAELVWASSDEPVNSIGDGNHEPDIVAGCDGFQLRSERQGPQNGRVYHIGWRAEDSGGGVVEGSCTVIVDHDQSAAITEDDGEAYRVELGAGECEEPEPDPEPDPEPPPPPPPTPPPPPPPVCPDPENPDCL